MFGGTAEDNETPEECFIRETKEELGIYLRKLKINLFEYRLDKERDSERYVYYIECDQDLIREALEDHADYKWISLEEIFNYQLTKDTRKYYRIFREDTEINIKGVIGNEYMKYAFISGIPASGKSYLAAKVAKAVGASHIEIDELRKEMRSDPELKRWVDFFWDQEEIEYWRNTNCNQQWENLKNQSETFWPIILKKINKIQESGKPAVFEGVNILPHLAIKDLGFPGIVLLGSSLEDIFERNKKEPRWGQTEELQRMETEGFWNCERPRYKAEAEKYGYPTFSDVKEAEKKLLEILQ